MRRANCPDCGGAVKHTSKLYIDPRTPPLATGLCLCPLCYRNAIQERIDDLTIELESAQEELRRLPTSADDGRR